MASFVRRFAPPLVLLVAGLVVTIPTQGQAQTRAHCPHFSSATTTGHVSGLPAIREISGVVSSRRYDRTLWVEQDSGNPARVDAIRPNGRGRASVAVTHAQNHDWEDIAFWHHDIWVGDIGDNASVRTSIAAYWFREPKLSARSVRGKMVTLHYPDGPHNAEAMFVTGGHLYVVSKERTLGTGTVYRADVSPLHDGQSRTMHKIGTVPIGNISGADVDQRGFVIRNYGTGLFYRWTGDHRVSSALRRTACVVQVGPGSESVAFATWNRSMFSIPEGTNPPVYVDHVR
jgi:hypothetical protein